jgi:hypothetical protein
VIYGSSHGGSGGGSFDDAVDLKLSPTTSCIGVEFFWESARLVAIRFIYEENNSSAQQFYHGSDGKSNRYYSALTNETFMMNAEERINKVTWYAGADIWYSNNRKVRYVLGIQLHTTAGRTSRLYGSSKGEMYTESYEGFTLGYAKGRSGLLVDMLQFVWYNQGE